MARVESTGGAFKCVRRAGACVALALACPGALALAEAPAATAPVEPADPPDKRRRIIDQQLELVGLSQWGDRYCSELSGGMQQRVGRGPEAR